MPEKARPEKSGGSRILRYSLIVIAIVLATPLLAGAWFLSDTDRVKRTLESVVTSLTDRPLRINGDFDFSLGSEITLKAKQAEWLNPAWSSTPNMIQVEEIEVSFNVWSIINPPVIITNGVADNAILEFEWTEDEKFNWWFGSYEDEPDEEDDNDDELREIPLLLDKARLTNIDIRFQHPALTEPLLIAVSTAEQEQDSENHLQLNIEADIDSLPASVQGRLGPFPSLIAGGAVDFELRGKGEETDIRLLGKVGELASFGDANLEFLLDATRFENVLDNLNLPVVTSGQMNIKGVINSVDERFLARINGPAGEFNIDADIEIADVTTLGGLKLEISSNGPNARAAGALVGIDGLPETNYTLTASATDSGKGVMVEDFVFKTETGRVEVGGTIRNYPDFDESDLTLELELSNAVRFDNAIPALTLPDLPLKIDARLLSNGIGADDKFSSQIALGSLQAELNGMVTDNFMGSKLKFSGSVPDGRILAALAGIELTDGVPVTTNGFLGIARDSISFSDTELKFGENVAQFNATVPVSGNDEAITLVGDVSGADFDQVSRLLDASDLAPPIPYKLSGDLSLDRGSIVFKKVTGNLGGTKLDVTGELDARQVIQVGQFNISAEGDNLSEALLTLGIEKIPDEPFTFRTELKFDADGFDFRDSLLKYGNNNISGRIRTPLQDSPGTTVFDLKGAGDDLGLLLSEIGGYEPAKVNFSAQAVGEYDEDHVYFDKAILKAGSATLELSGELDLSPQLQARNIILKGSGDRISDLGTFENFQFAALPFEISATLAGAENVLATQDLRFSVGKSNVSGRFGINATDKPVIRLQLKSNLLNLERILVDDEDAPTSLEGVTTTEEDRVIPDAQVPQDLLASYDAYIDLDINKLILKTITLDDFMLDATLVDSALDIYQIKGKDKAGNKQGTVEARISLTPDKGSNFLELSLLANDIVLDIPGLSVSDPKLSPGHDADIKISARGNSIHEMAATMNGFVWVTGGDRRIENLGVSRLFSDFMSQIYTIVNPWAEDDPYTEIVCDLYYFEAEDGVMKTAPAIFLRTNKMNIAADGKIDLNTEAINFKLATSPRRGIGISAGDIVNPLTRIDGTLSKPGVALNKTGATVQGGAAFATAGLSIIATGLWKRWLGPRKPCEKMAADAAEMREKRESELASSN